MSESDLFGLLCVLGSAAVVIFLLWGDPESED